MKASELKNNVKESCVQTQILHYLAYCRSVAKFWRVNTGAIAHDYTTKDGQFKQRFVRFGPVGQPDIQGFMKDGRALYIEVKRSPKSKKSEAQIEFIDEAKKNGCVAFFASSVEEVIQNLEERGY